MEFVGKTAFVTGAGSGIGRASAIAFAREGAKVMIVDLQQNGLDETAEEIRGFGGEVANLTLDVTDRDAVNNAIEATVECFGGLNCALNNAGISYPPINWETLPYPDARRIFEVNFWGVFHCMQAQVQYMLGAGGGTIVNTASGAGLVASPLASTYAASKHAVAGLTKSVGLEVAAKGIRINAICPGLVETGMTKPLWGTEVGNASVAAHPIGRIAQPSEMADAVLWLSSPRSSFVLAVNLPVDGGYTAP